MTRPIRHFPRILPRLRGHPVLEALVERGATQAAWRAGFLLSAVVSALAPGASLDDLRRSFDHGLGQGGAEDPVQGKVLPFPRR